jgi:competence protein ComEC
MRAVLLGFVSGAVALQLQQSLPIHPCWLISTALCLISAFPLYASFRLRHSYSFAAGTLLGFGWAAWLAYFALSPTLSAQDEGRDLTIVGTVANLPYRFPQGVRFNFAVERVEGDTVRPPPLITLAWYSGFRDEVNEVGDVQPGERWRLKVRLQRPHGAANPLGFDYEVWLLEQGIRATGYVRPASGNRRLDGFALSFNNVVEHCRAVLRERILLALSGKEYAGVIVALVVGDQRGIDQSDWQVFNRTGIGHLISISGLHITMVAGLFAGLASALWRRSFFTHRQLPLLLPAQKLAAIVGTVTAFAYVLLAGFGVPAQRTLYMLAVVAVALWTNRITSVSHILCTALGVVVLLDPWAVLWPGFWLSFGAVAVILYASVGRIEERTRRAAGAGVARGGSGACAALPPVAGWRQRWPGLLHTVRLGAHTQYAVTFGLVPLTMLLFAQISLVSPIANAVAIPLISTVVTPLALVGSLLPQGMAELVLGLAHWLVACLAACLRWMSDLPFAVWSAPTPPFWQFCWATFGTIWLLAPRGWPVRWLGLATWLPLLTATPWHPHEGQLRVVAFDIGQGMALLIQTSHHILLYDTGPAYSPENNAGGRVILPYLKAQGIDALDGLIVTHSDADHAGGAASILQGVKVGWLLSSLHANSPIVQAARSHRACSAGQIWNWDGVRFEMLHPSAASYADASLKSNARGCTLKITAGRNAILLAADIEAAQEAALIQQGSPIQADVLLVPHHGSGTSSTLPFLRAVHPALAVFQVGYRNRYHHPKAEVYARYGDLGIQRLRTDEAGAITLDFNGDSISASSYRIEHARYWYGR